MNFCHNNSHFSSNFILILVFYFNFENRKNLIIFNIPKEWKFLIPQILIVFAHNYFEKKKIDMISSCGLGSKIRGIKITKDLDLESWF